MQALAKNSIKEKLNYDFYDEESTGPNKNDPNANEQTPVAEGEDKDFPPPMKFDDPKP